MLSTEADIRHFCCGHQLRTITVSPAFGLTFTFCGRCEKMTWRSQGNVIDRPTGLALAGNAARSATRQPASR